jgi:hypothetical protein
LLVVGGAAVAVSAITVFINAQILLQQVFPSTRRLSTPNWSVQ